jgi:hypothetical protein
LTSVPGSVAEVVEEVHAVVAGTPILASDLQLARLVRLLDREPGITDDEYASRLLDARVRLEIQYRDLDRSGALYRLEIPYDSTLEAVVLRAGGESVLRPALGEWGLTWADVEDLALRIGAAQAYVDQRLRAEVTVGLADIEAAYADLCAEHRDRGLPPPPPLAALRTELHRLVVERQLNVEIERWLEQARERLEVTRFRR